MAGEKVSHEDIYQKVGAIDARLDGLEKWMESVDRNVNELRDAANMGKGAWWAALRIGAVLLLIIGAAAWVYDRVRGIFH